MILQQNIIERSTSAYHSLVVVVKKPDQTTRLCVDFRQLNKVTVDDCEPIPRVDMMFAGLCDKKFFSKFDFAKGYCQIPMASHCKHLTAFCSASGLYQFKVMPFGIKTAPAIFTRMMREVVQNINNVYHYFDDVLIATETWEEHLVALALFFENVRNSGLTIKPKKSEIGRTSIAFLGHVIEQETLQPMTHTLDKIHGAKRPETKKEVRSFLGLTGYYRDFIPNYAMLSYPLTELTKKRMNHRVKWGTEQEIAFWQLKESLSKNPILQVADLSKAFVLRADASERSLGVVLMQQHGKALHPVAYVSRKLLPRETAYSTIERECLALVWAVQEFHVFLYGKAFTVQTDHQPLEYIYTAKHLNNRVLR